MRANSGDIYLILEAVNWPTQADVDMNRLVAVMIAADAVDKTRC